jgi:hypothetical protein
VLGSVACIGFWNYARLSGPFRLLVWFLTYVLISETLTRTPLFAGKAFILYWIYNITALLVYCAILAWLSQKRSIRFGQISILFVSLLLSFYYLSKGNPFGEFPSILISISTPILVIGTLLLFVDLLLRDEHTILSRNPEFILGASLIIYKCISFVHLSLYDYLIELEVSPWVSIWVHSIASILYYALFGYIFILAAKQYRDKCSTSVVR